MGITNEYTHRNGERELPTEPGLYFFKGLRVAGDTGYGDQSGAMLDVTITNGIGWVHHGSNGWYLMQFEGRWWGPFTPPWESDHLPDARRVAPVGNVHAQPI